MAEKKETIKRREGRNELSLGNTGKRVGLRPPD